ncbi:MAG: InlB B-repeat-containing protein [Clostridia bacterium]|nr:InlB B-repeat-containing protein [Clostridia bacterium]
MKKQTLIKLLSLVLLSLMIFSLVACGGDKNEDSDKDNENETVTLTLDANGGVLPEGAEEEATHKAGTKIRKLATPTKEGAEFLGWFNDDGEKVTAPFTIEEDLYLTASWQGGEENPDGPAGPTVTITLVLNGGLLKEGQAEEFEAVIGEKLNSLLPKGVTRPGYTFLGWYEDGLTQYAIDKKSEVEDYDMEIHALWQANGEEVTVEFFLNADETLEAGAKTYFEMIAGEKIADFVDRLPTATKDGNKFVGWKDEATGNRVSLTTTVNADMRLTPVWTKVILCHDGTENHQWNAWQDYSEATCTTPAQQARVCNICGSTEYNTTQEATGHKFGNWATAITENGIVRSRICVECDEKEADPLTNIAYDKFQTPVIDGDCWGGDKGANLFDGNYTDKPIAAKGTGALTVTIEAKEATYVDIIAVTGFGSAAYNVTVYFEDGTSKDLGVGAFGSGDSATKAFNVNKVVTKIVVSQPSPANGTDYWSEVSILIVPTAD